MAGSWLCGLACGWSRGYRMRMRRRSSPRVATGPSARSTKSGARTSVPPSALQLLAEADGFQALGLDRRSALWAIRGLRDEALPLFAAADNGRAPRPEIVEPPVPIVPMIAGRNVVEDYATSA